ncbi:hypothetical protein SESBI_33533 [Sesbania bispinosa]|nr:hypothetical protein SESBI_33533 [Sesbania bispinosa]
MSEIFPIHVKGTAGSLVVLINWLGAWVVSYTFNFLMSWSSPVSPRNQRKNTGRNSGKHQFIEHVEPKPKIAAGAGGSCAITIIYQIL